MVNLRRFMSTTVAWEPRIGGDGYSGAEYGPPVEIPARKKLVAREVAGTGGAEVRNVDEISVPEGYAVQLGDKLDGEVVQSRKSIDNVRGRTKGHTFYTDPVLRS